MSKRYVIGLDLGQTHDFTAVAVGEWYSEFPSEGIAIRHLERVPLRTSYPEVVDRVVSIIQRGRFPEDRLELVVDATGVGRPVVDLFLDKEHDLGLRPVAVTITAGADVAWDEDEWRVPKRDLVSAVQVGLQTQTLKVARDLPDTEILINELHNFQVRVTAAQNDTYGAWREGTHDDLVLAVALCCWWISVAPEPAMVW